MKLLSTITENIKVLVTHGNVDVYISGLTLNSNDITPNCLFVAIRGATSDGHTYVGEAIKNGATVIVYESDLQTFDHNVTYIKVKDTKEALGIMASNFYDNPSHKIKLIGVTGTNGKTTITTLLYQLFKDLGHKVGLIGTVVNKINDESFPADRTTPDSITLNKLLDMMVEEGCEYCFMEVSSHAISLKRVEGINFAGGVFTNLTLDHLDYHKTLENYRDTKKMFFDTLHENAFSLSNLDDGNGPYMLKDSKSKKYFYSLKEKTDFSEKIETKLIGDFNAYNIIAIYGTAIILGQEKEKVKQVIKTLEPVEGRFNYIKSNSGVTGIVDYAHTPDALENVLKTINNMKGNGKVISVFGCGGDRDRTKRPIMARIGYEMSDIVILTSDNPRTENPNDILDDMLDGVKDLPKEKVLVIVDRSAAIGKSVELASSGDFILVAGKGHEKYHEVNGIKTHFDDMEELKKYFNI